MRRALAVAAACALLAACGNRADEELDRLNADPLFRRADKVALSGDCAKLVPMEDGRTLPLPDPSVKDAFVVAFYHPKDRMKDYHARPPEFAATFTLDAARSPECRSLPAVPDQDLGPALAPGLPRARYLKAMADYHAALPKLAQAYAAGSSTDDVKNSAAALVLDFKTAAEPGLSPYYYRMNPDWWEWLRRTGGDSLPKP